MFQVLDTPGHSVSRRRTQDDPQETPIRLLGIQHNMWLDAKSQRRKVINAAIEVAAFLYMNDNLQIDQRLKVISMCLLFFFSCSAPLIDWPESYLKLFTAVWVRSYKNAWNLGKSTATCLFTFPREKGGLQVKLPLGSLFTSVWGILERCSQFNDSTRQMLAMCYEEALQENGCLDLLELQDASQHLSWKAASTNQVTIACYLASKLDNTGRVGPIPHRPYCICFRCHSGSPRMLS